MREKSKHLKKVNNGKQKRGEWGMRKDKSLKSCVWGMFSWT